MKISIITATYNSAKNVSKSIVSVNNQTHPDIEQIIIDGASGDNTIAIIKSQPNRVKKLVSEPDKGIYDALNKGIKLATGNIIGLVHSGDELAHNEVISQIIRIFLNEKCDILYGNTECFLPSHPSKIVRIDRGGNFKKNRFRMGWMPSHPTIYCKKEIFELLGAYRLDLKIAADYEFLLRAMYVHEFKIHYLDSIIYRYELGGTSSKNLKNIILSNLECKKAWLLNGMQPPSFLIFKKLLRKIPQFLKSINYKENN
jgi:glycosyltransferase